MKKVIGILMIVGLIGCVSQKSIRSIGYLRDLTNAKLIKTVELETYTINYYVKDGWVNIDYIVDDYVVGFSQCRFEEPKSIISHITREFYIKHPKLMKYLKKYEIYIH